MNKILIWRELGINAHKRACPPRVLKTDPMLHGAIEFGKNICLSLGFVSLNSIAEMRMRSTRLRLRVDVGLLMRLFKGCFC